jgi:calcineurin-like phosphoesterase family protein
MEPMTWLTADEHFGHTNIIKFCNRPFSTIEEMNEAIIARHNEVVGIYDTVWHLGDFAWHNANQYLKRLNGKHHLIFGNHDKKHIKREFDFFSSAQDVHKLKWMGVSIWLSHYAHLRWPSAHHGTLHAFGHSHGQCLGIGRSKDVGVDTNNFYPYPIDDFVASLSSIPIT